jgi:hypothetical protein
MVLGYIKVIVNLKLGMMFVGFFKTPDKVPINNDGSMIPKKNAHFILCDGRGDIHSMSHNCIHNLGIPPTFISKARMETNLYINID